MRNAKELIGMPVVVASSGQEIERVEGIVLDSTETRVSALLVDSDDWSQHARVIPLEDIRSFGKTAVSVSSENAIHDVVQMPEVRRTLNQTIPLRGTHLITRDGVDVGTVNDVSFNEQTGGIETFLFSRRNAGSSRMGRFMLPVFDALDEEVIAHATNVKQHENQGPAFKSDSCVELQAVSGLRIAPHRRPHIEILAKDSDVAIQQIVVKQSGIQQWSERFWRMVKTRILSFFKRGPKSVNSYRIQRALGRRVHHRIVDSQGGVVVDQGQEITVEAIVKARKAGVLDELLSAAERSSRQNSQELDEMHHGRMDEWIPPFL